LQYATTRRMCWRSSVSISC
jgi:hypothetical protein